MNRPHRGLWTLGVRAPAADADRAERLRFVRDFNARWAVITSVMLVLALAVGAAAWVIALIGVGLVALLLDVAWLTRELTRDRDTTA